MSLFGRLLQRCIGLFQTKKQEPSALKPSIDSLKNKIEQYKKLLLEHPYDPILHYKAGTVYLELERFREGLKHFKEVLRLEPEHPSATFMMGKALIGLGQDDDAVDALTGALEKNPDSPATVQLLAEAHKNLCVSFGKLKLYEKSLAHYKEAVRLVPDYGAAHLALGMNYIQEGRNQDALKELKTALRMDKNLLVDVYYYYGIVYAKLGDHRKAVNYYKDAISASPKAALCYLNLGLLLSKLKRYEEAVPHLQNAIAMSPNITTDAPFQLAFAFYNLKRFEEGVEPLRKALEKSPDHKVVRALWNSCLFKVAEKHQGDIKILDEIIALKEIVAVDPESGEAHRLLSLAYDKLNKGIDAAYHTTITRMICVEQRDEAGMEKAIRFLAKLYKKYDMTAEDFKKVKIPRRRYN